MLVQNSAYYTTVAQKTGVIGTSYEVINWLEENGDDVQASGYFFGRAKRIANNSNCSFGDGVYVQLQELVGSTWVTKATDLLATLASTHFTDQDLYSNALFRSKFRLRAKSVNSTNPAKGLMFIFGIAPLNQS
jgi:hypothetical protein